MVFFELCGLLQGNEGIGAHLRGGRTGIGSKERNLDRAPLWDRPRGRLLLDGRPKQIRHDLFESAVFMDRLEFESAHQIAGQIKSGLHPFTLLVFWHPVKTASKVGSGP